LAQGFFQLIQFKHYLIASRRRVQFYTKYPVLVGHFGKLYVISPELNNNSFAIR